MTPEEMAVIAESMLPPRKTASATGCPPGLTLIGIGIGIPNSPIKRKPLRRYPQLWPRLDRRRMQVRTIERRNDYRRWERRLFPQRAIVNGDFELGAGWNYPLMDGSETKESEAIW